MTDSTRVNETIAFINNYTGSNNNVTPVQRQTAAQFCRQQYPKLKLLDFGPNKHEFHTLSSDMSVKQHASVPAGSHADRAKRRAIFLIWASLKKAAPTTGSPAQAAMTMATASLDAALAAAIKKVSVYATPGGATDVFHEVLTNPLKFLAVHKVVVHGAVDGADKFTNLANPIHTNVLQFHFQYEVAFDRFLFHRPANPGVFGQAHICSAISVPGVPWTDVPNVGQAPYNFAQIVGCELTGANFMVTTQFSGCTFCWTDNGILRAAHIGPKKVDTKTNVQQVYPQGGIALATRIAAGGMANAGGAALHVFGSGFGNAPRIAGQAPFYPDVGRKYVSIIGSDIGGWKFYMQVIDDSNQISDVRQIH